MKSNNHMESMKPPKWAERFFSWFCKTELWEALSGDLEEEFIQRANEKGLRYAKWIYICQIISFLRPFVIKKSHFFKNPIMFEHHLKISLRNILSHKWQTILKMIDLA